MENVTENVTPAEDEVGDDYSPVDAAEEKASDYSQSDVFVIPRTTFNYVVIAATFLVVGIILGAIMFGARGGGIDRAELATIVENAVDAALNSNTADGLDPQQTYAVSYDEDDPSIGPKDAKVVVIEFSDFRCPYCGRFAAETLPSILDNYSDKILYVYRDYPQFGALSVKSALAAECADDQGGFWMMHNLLLANRPLLEAETIDATLTEFATQIGLDMESYNRCMETQAHVEEISVDFRDGQEYGPIGTPTFFINGKPIIGAQSYLVFATAIDEALAAAENAG